LPPGVAQLTPLTYRNPGQVAVGGVLVVGASASGVQIAEELSRAGRDVTLAAGAHLRVPRTYRGMDIHWWLQNTGLLDVRYDAVDDLVAARRKPSFQLVGSPERRDVDLNALRAAGVRVTGRLAGMQDGTAMFSGSLAHACASADLTLGRLLDRVDGWASRNGLDRELDPASRPARTVVTDAPTTLPLDRAGIRTVVWATGYRAVLPGGRDVPAHDGGVACDIPGLYLMGLPFLRRRKSTFVDGAGPDATDLAAHLAAHLGSVSAGTVPAWPLQSG
jgi:putative flavoprotein involved in K+ transport